MAGLAAVAIPVSSAAHASRTSSTTSTSTSTTRKAPKGASVSELRSLADHYRTITWDFERAAKAPRIPSSFSYRRSTDRSYLRWTIDTWTRRADAARRQALAALHRRLAVQLPAGPALRAPLYRRLVYTKRLAVRLRRIYPGRVSKAFIRTSAPTARATLRLWQKRSAQAAIEVAKHGVAATAAAAIAPRSVPAWLQGDLLCIHRYEGSWDADTGNGYYGGLQMDEEFMRAYGSDFVGRWGSADHWPVWAQLAAGARAEADRGFSPWPNTARACGLL